MSDRSNTVVICAYSDRRWTAVCRAVESVRSQRHPADEIILVIDHNPSLHARARTRFADVLVLESEHERGLSGARNTGVRHASGQVVVFLDDDAAADPDWLGAVSDAFEDPMVIGVGGVARPEWTGERPRWFPDEFLWVVGCSYRGLPADRTPVRNPIGANMAFRRDAFDRIRGFATGVGRVGSKPLGCEETEFAIRLQRAITGSRIIHVPEAAVRHVVPSERTTWRYFASRCWYEGLSKASVTGGVGTGDGLASERAYVTRTLPAGIVRGIGEVFRGDCSGGGRSVAIVAGLAATAAGYLVGVAARCRRSRASGRSSVSAGAVQVTDWRGVRREVVGRRYDPRTQGAAPDNGHPGYGFPDEHV